MASHFSWYPSSEEVVVPFNARYSFPSQANKSVKVTPRIPPTTGSTTTFSPSNNVIRLQLPAQGYMNARNSTLEFDVTLGSIAAGGLVRFQNNIQSIFQNARLLYGSTPLEEIQGYNILVRQLTEWTGTTQVQTLDQASVADGIGGVVSGVDGHGFTSGPNYQSGATLGYPFNIANNMAFGYTSFAEVAPFLNQVLCSGGSYQNVRQKFIHGIDSVQTGNGTDANIGSVPNSTATRRYQVKLAFGLFQQEKLIPLKWMASQLTIELTLAPAASCLFQRFGSADGTYSLTNVNFIPEILEFDASYDAMFLKGLREGGVPIKFASWHRYIQTIGGSSQVSFPIQERARSVKSIFTVQRRGTDIIQADSGAAFFATNSGGNGGTLQNYQYRIGGRYFPATPVQCSTTISSAIHNGAAEAFVELEKALNTLSDNRLSVNVDAVKWASPFYTLPSSTTTNYFPWPPNAAGIALQEADYSGGHWAKQSSDVPVVSPCWASQASNIGSSAFCMAVDLETSNGVEISGLNAEEQSDITLVANYSAPQSTGYQLEAYVYYDAMIVLRENNVLELIQ